MCFFVCIESFAIILEKINISADCIIYPEFNGYTHPCPALSQQMIRVKITALNMWGNVNEYYGYLISSNNVKGQFLESLWKEHLC